MSSRSATIRYIPSATENAVCRREDKKCTRTRAEGQHYCLRHLRAGGMESQSQTKSFTRCNYISSRTGHRCANISLKNECGKEGFCMDHARLVTHVRRLAAKRNRYRNTPEALLHTLGHYKQFESVKTQPPQEQLHPSTSLSNAQPQRPPIDYFSESSDEDESTQKLDDIPLFTDDYDALVDDSDEPLKHAGTYTTEEIVTCARDKLVKLQSLYGQYFKILELKLRHSKARFLPKLKAEAEKYGPLEKMDPKNYRERKKLLQLRALRRYKKPMGLTALLRSESIRRRKLASGLNVEKEVGPEKCSFSDGKASTPCQMPALPETQFCFNHILEDSHQLLFGKCEKEGCQVPIPLVGGLTCCWIHRPLTQLSRKETVVSEPPLDTPNIMPPTPEDTKSEETIPSETNPSDKLEDNVIKDANTAEDTKLGTESQGLPGPSVPETPPTPSETQEATANPEGATNEDLMLPVEQDKNEEKPIVDER